MKFAIAICLLALAGGLLAVAWGLSLAERMGIGALSELLRLRKSTLAALAAVAAFATIEAQKRSLPSQLSGGGERI